MRFGPAGGQSTKSLSPYDAMVSLSETSGIPVSTVTSIQNGMGLTPGEMMKYIVGLATEHEANPKESPGQLAAKILGASPSQVQAIDKTQKASESTKGQTGLFTDIFGDLFEVIYPFFMITLGAVALLGFVIVTLVAIAKSGAGKSALSGAAAGAGFAALTA